MSFNGNIDVSADGAAKNPTHGFAFQLPTPAGDGPSPWRGGLLNIGSLMQSNGYRTGHIGKWHLGGCSPPGNHTPAPSEYGYDFTATHASPLDAGCLPSSSKDLNIGATARDIFPEQKWWSADVDGVAKDLTIDFIRNATRDQQPFYVHFHLHASHGTIDPRPEQYNRTYPFAATCQLPRTAAWAAANPGGNGIPGEPCEFQAYWGNQHWADTKRIKPVVDEVDHLGVRNNTYIIFTTDNGPAASQEPTKGMALTSQGVTGVFRGKKASLYEGGQRVPFIITGPRILQSHVDDSLSSNVDWMPTLASLAHIIVPREHVAGLRGIDISPVLTSRQARLSRTQPLFWRGGGGAPPCHTRSPSLAMREGDWKLLFTPRRLSAPAHTPAAYRVELYNVSLMALVEQGGSYLESSNEAKYQLAVVERMMTTMMAWHGATPCPFGNHNNTREGTCTWMEIPFTGCDSYPLPGRPQRSCRGRPCPPAGTTGPCICAHEEEDMLFAAHLELLAM